VRRGAFHGLVAALVIEAIAALVLAAGYWAAWRVIHGR